MPQTTELSTYEEFLASIAHGKRPGRVTTEDNYSSELGSGKRAPFPIFWENPRYPLNGLEYYLDANNHITRKWARNTAGIDEVALVTGTGGSSPTDSLNALAGLIFQNLMDSDTEGNAHNLATTSASGNDLFRWHQDVVTATNNTANVTLVAKHASYAIEVMTLCVTVVPLDDTGVYAPLLTYQDEDDTACEGMGTIECNAFVCDLTNSKLFGQTSTSFPWGMKSKTPAVNKDAEVDIGGIGAAVGNTIRIHYAWRYVAA